MAMLSQQGLYASIAAVIGMAALSVTTSSSRLICKWVTCMLQHSKTQRVQSRVDMGTQVGMLLSQEQSPSESEPLIHWEAYFSGRMNCTKMYYTCLGTELHFYMNVTSMYPYVM